ncbi:PIK3R4 [Lepeophtheirus salmonis]|uniref:non-specific serine/threonine protein kinase n=1 Tax=Lepeophtheirus salmonis TaxID=72036 RepID=A0A7R8CEL6_LEPSM|nr:PIK3R4 [Lepeophtheirus salmonis]CAF2797245.1 PIK3R4 [Lepeophtheirus salmonis]
MGNQLVSKAPSQIFPVEHYMTDIGDLEFETNLGSTRFFKVALAREKNDHFVVLKVFTIQDLSLNLNDHRIRVLELKRLLGGAFHCLPFVRATLSERMAFLVRPYIKYSLYDRLSTRPFLKNKEKLWLAFQLLLAIQQAHKHGVVHGDIKSENVLLTGCNWLFLSDFASYKPTFLPKDNPADFSYFFDTSRRRTCYVAPERFKSRSQVGKEANQKDPSLEPLLPDTFSDGELLPSMDIFSAGCCLIELFTDGSIPFTFSQLLAYQSSEYSPQSVIDKINDESIKIPSKEIPQINIYPKKSLIYSQHIFIPFFNPTCNFFHQKTNVDDFDGEGLILITSLVTSNMRSLGFADSKLLALSILVKLATHLPEDIVLDRVIPYIIDSLTDFSSSVRISAIDSLTKSLSKINCLDPSEGNIFPDYILPALAPLCSDRIVLVRTALAKNIADIALESVRFLDMVMVSGEDDPDRPISSYEAEISDLHNCLSHMVSVLLSDVDNLVKQTLMEYSVKKLSLFFGKLKANDVLLSHMITFLNDKEDSQLRRSFYENIVGVASYVGNQCSPILLPLLQQGLCDPEEFVISECISAMARLTLSGLLHKMAIYELLRETVPYLLHPSLWIRQATAGFVSIACQKLDNVDIHVKIGTLMEPFLKCKVVQMSIPVLILSNLESPIPRNVFDGIIMSPDIEKLFKVLENRKTSRSSAIKSPQNISYPDMEVKLKLLFKRLISDGMSSSTENKILYMKENIMKLSRNKNLLISKQKTSTTSPGIIDLKKLKMDNSGDELRIRVIQLSKTQTPSYNNQDFHTGSIANEEWQHMFGTDVSTRHSQPEVALDALEQTNSFSPPLIEMHKSLLDIDDDAYIQYDRPPCQVEVANLINWRCTEYSLLTQRQGGSDNEESSHYFPNNAWRPQGTLIAHLHEHKGGITRLVNVPKKSIFASSATDGTIRIWNVKKIEESDTANESISIFKLPNNVPITGLATCSYTDILGFSTENGNVSILRLDGSKVLDTKELNVDRYGPPVQVHFIENGSAPILVCGTSFGNIIGLMTSISVSPDQYWAVTGSASGVLSTWDFRFSIPIVEWIHPSESRIRDTLIHPNEPASVIASTQANNEVGIWNVESQYRSTVLWASNNPVLSATEASPHSVCSMFCICSKASNTNSIITGGTDMRLRFWDLTSPPNSYVFASAATENLKPNPSHISFESKLVDGTRVIREVNGKSDEVSNSRNSNPTMDKSIGLDDPVVGHHDWISAITMCETSRWYIISGSRDGVIKVWK